MGSEVKEQQRGRGADWRKTRRTRSAKCVKHEEVVKVIHSNEETALGLKSRE